MKIPEGWKLVPEKETHQMRSAFREAEKGALLSGHDHIEAFFCGYRAMLAAAPTPPARDGLKVEFTKDWCMKMAQLEGDSAIGAGVPEVEHVAVVINNSQPGWENIIETIPLETLVAEIESDPEMKAVLDEARKMDMLEGATVTEITPAQEEPAAYRTFDPKWGDYIYTGDCKSHPLYPHRQWETLYTSPDSSELRKAAGEALKLLDKLGSGPTIENLRAALEGK